MKTWKTFLLNSQPLKHKSSNAILETIEMTTKKYYLQMNGSKAIFKDP